MIQLPHKLSELLEMALADVKALEKNERYRIRMGEWHRTYRGQRVCSVCAAGAVMACRLNISGDTQVDETQHLSSLLGEHNFVAMLAIDELRKGSVSGALQVLEQGYAGWDSCDSEHELDRYVEYYNGPDCQWHQDMAKLLADLKGAGL